MKQPSRTGGDVPTRQRDAIFSSASAMGCSVKVTYGMFVDHGFHLLMKEARLCLSH